jgi:succinate dehydrogenase hydrophobic anchor subunit
MSETYSQCPRCNYRPAAPLPVSEPCPACGIYTFKCRQHLSVPSNEPITRSSLRTRWAEVDPIIRIKMGLMLAFLGGLTSAQSLASGTISISRNGYALSRANAPLEFWFLVLSALALAVFGTCLAGVVLMKDRADSEVAALGINRRKIFQYLGLFCVLVVIYSIYMKGIVEGPDEGELSAPVWSLAKFCFISALPFGLLACAAQAWRSSDAAPVSVVAWITVFGGFSLKYPGGCPFAAFLLFVPLVLSALLGHTVGTLFHQENTAT